MPLAKKRGKGGEEVLFLRNSSKPGGTEMKKLFFCMAGILFVLGCAAAGGLQTSSDPSAKIEKVEFKPDKEGDFYAHVTVRNVSGKDQPFYLVLQAEDQPPQLTASGPSGSPNPVRAGEAYTFKLNTLLKKEPKNVSIEILEKLPR
jgi:hypothetical protein